MKNILILGSGGIASLYGSMMQRHGFSVSLYARRNSEEIASGIQVDSVWGNYFFRPENVFTEIDFSKYRPDLIISSLKALPEIRLETILKGLPDKIPVLLLQNGIGLEEEFSRLFPSNPVFAGLAFVCSNRHSPVYVNHLDYGQITVSPYLASDMQLAERIYGLFRDSGVPSEIIQDYRLGRWKKLMWNAPFNPLSVLCGGASTKDILENPHTLDLTKKIMQEVLKTAHALNVPLKDSQPDEFIEMTFRMKPYKTSMLLDFENRRPMEIDVILGNTLKFAGQAGLELPHIYTMYCILKMRNYL